jgi:hypothetical protein
MPELGPGIHVLIHRRGKSKGSLFLKRLCQIHSGVAGRAEFGKVEPYPKGHHPISFRSES